ncbi:MAG: hypothetical protein VYA54_05075 [Bdellovibrionota bacterium]|nr:hypothetical protein [Bdellovibrionota bacterium]
MNTPSEDQKVSLSDFANLAGFPVELVRKELVLDGKDSDEISMDDLRAAMLKYLDQAMLN